MEPRSVDTWIGADPGGIGTFGLAILKSDGSAHTCSVDCVDHAINVVKARVPVRPAGVGVDAPLWWSSGPSGGRVADQWLRDRYRLSGGQVQAVNSLGGACLAQGMMFVQRIHELFPDVGVTESHPKAVLVALGLDWAAFSRRFSVTAQIQTENERDALISAVAAREGFQGRWKRDLSAKRGTSEQDPAQYWLAPVHYYWPDQ